MPACEHLRAAADRQPAGQACVECMCIGSSWVALRLCVACGNLACCDASPNQHARAHWQASGHPVVRSAEVGERWVWCYAHSQRAPGLPLDLRSGPGVGDDDAQPVA